MVCFVLGYYIIFSFIFQVCMPFKEFENYFDPDPKQASSRVQAIKHMDLEDGLKRHKDAIEKNKQSDAERRAQIRVGQKYRGIPRAQMLGATEKVYMVYEVSDKMPVVKIIEAPPRGKNKKVSPDQVVPENEVPPKTIEVSIYHEMFKPENKVR